MKKLLILLLILTSCGKSKELIQSAPNPIDTICQVPILVTTRKDIKLAKIEAKEAVKIEKEETKQNKTNAKKEIRLAEIELKLKLKHYKFMNDSLKIDLKLQKKRFAFVVDSLQKQVKLARIEAKVQKSEIRNTRKIANSENNKDIAKWIGISICAILLLVVILFVYLKFIR